MTINFVFKVVLQTAWLIFFFALASCSKKLVPTSINDPSLQSAWSFEEKKTIGSLNTTVERLVRSGGNIRRGKAILERIKDFRLTENTSKENIDWLSFQKNILIEIKGKTDKVVYIVSHYDKTDINPITFLSVLLDGFLDPLLSWAFLSDGAIDNATGVAVSLQLAKELSQTDLRFTYRILLVGSEESGLRGSRSHVARLSDSLANNILYVINTDIVGVRNKINCVTTNISHSKLTELSLEIAKELNIELGNGKMPFLGCSDYAAFKKTSFLTDFSRSLQFNMVGAFLPQRSYFTKKRQTEIINFSSCELLDAGDYVGGALLFPIGAIHGFRDDIKLVDERKLYEQYKLTLTLVKKVDSLDIF